MWVTCRIERISDSLMSLSVTTIVVFLPYQPVVCSPFSLSCPYACPIRSCLPYSVPSCPCPILSCLTLFCTILSLSSLSLSHLVLFGHILHCPCPCPCPILVCLSCPKAAKSPIQPITTDFGLIRDQQRLNALTENRCVCCVSVVQEAYRGSRSRIQHPIFRMQKNTRQQNKPSNTCLNDNYRIDKIRPFTFVFFF